MNTSSCDLLAKDKCSFHSPSDAFPSNEQHQPGSIAAGSSGRTPFLCSILSLLWSQLAWEREVLPSWQQVLAPALAVNSKFLNSYLEQGLRAKRQAVMCRSPEMSWFDMTHFLPSLPHLLTSQVSFKSIFPPLPRLTIRAEQTFMKTGL